jgi:hypothetical protein
MVEMHVAKNHILDVSRLEPDFRQLRIDGKVGFHALIQQTRQWPPISRVVYDLVVVSHRFSGRCATERLSQRFPPGLKYLVNYNTTVFVRDTIRDVLITLAIAFVLVVIVVFVFLGSLRATLIPPIAVPVSVIGSFAVLLAAGYSANTISLLAMVLAIGILVDDAIVVVENVERAMEEEPALSPAEATKKAMAEITAPIIAITLVLFSVFVPIAFIAGVSGTLFRQFAVAISVAMLISAVNALTLSPALCAVFLSHRGPKRGPMGWVLRRIDNIRDGYAAIVRRLVRVAALGVVTILVSAAGIYLLSLRTPTGFLPEEDQGPFFISVQLPDLAAIAKLDNGSAAAAPTRAPDSPRPPMAPTAESTLKVAGERRHVTVMFCDLVDSTGIAAKLDAEEWRDLVGAYIDASSIAVTDMGGKVAKKLGDGLMALFGYPVAQENDAERAVRAALSIQRALAELNLKNEGTGKPALAARIAIDSGPVVIDAGGEIFGDIPNVAGPGAIAGRTERSGRDRAGAAPDCWPVRRRGARHP